MKLREIFRLELRMQGRRASTWLYTTALLAFSYMVGAQVYVEEARTGGYLVNAPFVIGAVMVLGTLMGLLAVPGLAGEAGARDARARTHPLMFTTPITRLDYLGGRFLAALTLYALVLLTVPLGLLIASRTADLPPELIGPIRPTGWLLAWLVVALPNAMVTTALPFCLAVLRRGAMASYLASVVMFIGSVASWQLLALRLGRWELAKLLDPLGLVAVSELSRTWTPVQKSTLLVGLQPSLLLNRLLWLGVAAAVLTATYHRFRLADPGGKGRGGRRLQRSAAQHPAKRAAARPAARSAAPAGRAASVVAPEFGRVAQLRQLAAIARDSARAVLFSWGGALLAGLAVLVVLTGAELLEVMGVPLVPRTEHVLTLLGGTVDLVWLVIPLVTVFYAGELVWRERDARLSALTDAAPVPLWVVLGGKMLGLVLVFIALQALLLLAGVILQVRLGYHELELGLYARILFGLQLPGYLLFAVLAMVIHVVVGQKYVGHLLGAAAYGLMAFGPALGLTDPLLLYGSTPGWSYTDMRGFGSSLGPWLWFTLYWAGWALVLTVLAALLWPRGTEDDLRHRLGRVSRRFTRSAAVTGGVAAALVVVTGGFLFYNTRVLNEPVTAAEAVARRAEYERRYGEYERRPQPLLTAVSLQVDIRPDRREAIVRGTYRLVNRTGVPIDSVHLATASEVETDSVRFGGGATPVLVDDDLGHRIYSLDHPLQPGDSLRLAFTVRFQPRGFRGDGADASVVANGTYFSSQEWMPTIGYQPSRELSNPAERRAHGLPARPPVRPVEEPAAPYDMAGAERIAFEAVVATDSGQVAVAPGRLRRTWVEGDRRFFEYGTDAPIRNDYAFFSADYAVHEGRWNDVLIQVYHHPGHGAIADGMIRGVRAALDHMTTRYGPYPYGMLRLVEHPGHGNTLHSYPINISYKEGFSLMDAGADRRGIDFPFAIVAHEVAHQWWGNQITPAHVEGAPLLTEGLAWYSAMRVVEETYGAAHLQRLRSLLWQDFQVPRSRGVPPLLRATGGFLAYRKGPFALYALGEYIGHARVDTALVRLLDEHRHGTPPLPTSLDLYDELQAVTPDSLRGLLHDLFRVNTYWDLETEAVRAERAGDGDWRVTLDVRARKVAVDTTGVETELGMDGLVEIGVFAPAETGERREVLHLALHRIRSGPQQITVTVPEKPVEAGVDPRRLLIDLEPADNTAQVNE